MSNQSAVAARTCRILYYGPHGAGKRLNLSRIAGSIPAENRLALATPGNERSLAFRLLSGEQGEWTVLLQAIDTGYEPPGANPADSALPYDGIVFVANSTASHLDQSLSSLEALKAYLDGFDTDITSVPLVIQYNAREEDGCLPVDRLESLLNPWGLLSFPASAEQSEGVKETLKAILSLTISKLVQDPPASETATTGGSGAGENCLEDRAEKRAEVQESVSEPVFSQPAERTEIQIVSENRSGIFFEDLRPPIVVPVRIPKRLLDKFGSVRIILEIELDEKDSMLS